MTNTSDDVAVRSKRRRDASSLAPTSMYPLLYQINTRVWLRQHADRLGRPATLDDIADDELDRIAAERFDWVYLLGVWQTGAAGQTISASQPEWRRAFAQVLDDLTDRDICGSCFAVTGYSVHPALGGDAALRRLRQRLAERGMRLMLDFVPNHMALDHPWVTTQPDRFVQGTSDDLARTPQNYCRMDTARGPVIFAHGRDPYFPGWPDTLQLDYGNPATQEAMLGELVRIAAQCDGVRCDMAMLVLPDVFARTWQIAAAPFWPNTIRRVKQQNPAFVFMAEVYWDLEWELQQQGFQFTYDKRLYDRLSAQSAGPARDHLKAGLDFQSKLARFLENHDEPRAAATFPLPVHQAAAVVSFLVPGLRFLHQGQFEGCAKHIPIHLCRGPAEPPVAEVQAFYRRLLSVLRRPTVRTGEWRLLDCDAAWQGNWTSADFIAFTWQNGERDRVLAVINYAGNQGQCHVRLPWSDIAGKQARLSDLMGPAVYDRPGDELLGRGMYLDLPAWGYHVFELAVIA